MKIEYSNRNYFKLLHSLYIFEKAVFPCDFVRPEEQQFHIQIEPRLNKWI